VAAEVVGPEGVSEADPGERVEIAGLEGRPPAADDHPAERAAAGADARDDEAAHAAWVGRGDGEGEAPAEREAAEIDGAGDRERVQERAEVGDMPRRRGVAEVELAVPLAAGLVGDDLTPLREAAEVGAPGGQGLGHAAEDHQRRADRGARGWAAIEADPADTARGPGVGDRHQLGHRA
jgi:hypothetical protein